VAAEVASAKAAVAVAAVAVTVGEIGAGTGEEVREGAIGADRERAARGAEAAAAVAIENRERGRVVGGIVDVAGDGPGRPGRVSVCERERESRGVHAPCVQRRFYDILYAEM
jgi:hypothetical protein